MMSSRLVRVVPLLLLVAGSALADPRVLFRSGATADDGTVLATLERPHPAGAAGIAILGTTAALMTRSGTDLAVVARTGDPAPAPLAGTFDTFESPVITASGVIAFHATLNATGADEGIFLQDGATVEPVVTSTGIAAPLGAFDVNAALDVAYVQDDAIYLWSHASKTATRLVGRGDAAPGGGDIRHIGRAVLNDAGTVAFAATLKGASDALFTVSLRDGTRFIGRRRFGPGAISINASGQLAFASDGRSTADFVLRYEPGSNSVTVVAKKDDKVGDVTLTTIDPEFVAIDPQGRIAFEARVDAKGAPRRLFFVDAGGVTQLTGDLSRTAADFAPRLTSADRIVWTQDRRVARFDGAVKGVLGPGDGTPIGPSVNPASPSINDAGTVVFTASHEALYLVDGGVARPAVKVGDRLINGSVITAIGAHGAFDGGLVFRATLDGIDVGLLLVRNGAIDRIVTVGDVTPVGGKFASIGETIDVGADGAVFTASVTGGKANEGVFRASVQNGRIEVLATSRGKRGKPHQFTSPVVAGTGAVFRALTGAKAGLFGGGAGGKVRKLVAVGQPARGTGGRVTGLRDFAASGRGAIVVATLKKASAPNAVLAVQKGKVAPLLTEGDSAPGGGAFTAVDGAVLAMSDAAAAILAPLFGAGAARGLFLLTDVGPTLLLLDGTAVPGGGAAALGLTTEFALDGASALLETRLAGGGAARALVAVP